jgi:hypothetical protein
MDKDTLFSSFRKWVAPLNTTLISNWTLETGEDRYVKKLDTLAYLLIFIDAQLQQHRGLRDIAADLCHNEAFQQELGLRCISTSQLSRKNNKLSPEILQQLFCDLVQQISQQSHPHPSRVGQVKLLDSTTVSLCLQKYKWAEYRKTKAGIKLHVRVAFGDPDTVYPDKVELTPAKPADRTQMDTLIDDKGVTYIFDRGYVDYDKFNGYSLDGTFFVTRLKDNAVMETLHEFDTAKDSPISRDRMVKLGQGKKQTHMVFRVIETLSRANRLRF